MNILLFHNEKDPYFLHLLPVDSVTMSIHESKVSNDFDSESEHLPLVLVHRIFSLHTQLTTLLRTHFQVLDPHCSSQSLHCFLSGSHAQSVRVIVVYGMAPLTAETIRLLSSSLELLVGTAAGVWPHWHGRVHQPRNHRLRCRWCILRGRRPLCGCSADRRCSTSVGGWSVCALRIVELERRLPIWI